MTGGSVIATVFGADFSGARLAGKNTWVARFDVEADRLLLRELASLESLAKTAERGPVNLPPFCGQFDYAARP